MGDWIRKGRSVFEPKHKVKWPNKPRFHFAKRARIKKAKTTFTPEGGVSKKEQKILAKASKPTKGYTKNPRKHAMKELEELNEG